MGLDLDIIIPCYNAETTLKRAVDSCLRQASHRIILVDDGSSDNTWQMIQALQADHRDKITGLQLPENSGVAVARNWGAIHSQAELLAFLDADDAFEMKALNAVPTVFEYLPALSLLRLGLKPMGFPKKFTEHERFDKAWESIQMTVGGNTVFRRSVFLACGGFPQDVLFRQLGGEDGALGIALVRSTAVGTLFESRYAGVIHHYHPNMHAERLLRAYLFNEHDIRITETARKYADNVTQRIINRLSHLQMVVTHQSTGRRPIHIEYEDDTQN